jgi:hypothetical protein
VLGYSPERQRQFMTRIGMNQHTWEALATLLIIASTVVTVILFLLMARRMRATADPVARAYLAFCGKLAGIGLPREPSEGPTDYSERLARARPDLQPPVRAITRLYIALRYGASPDPGAKVELLQRVRDFSAAET